MNTIGHNSIVVGIDGSPSSEAAFDWALDEAARRHLPLHLVSARERDLPIDAGLLDSPATATAVMTQARNLTEELLATHSARALRAHPTLAVTTESSPSFAAAALVELSSRADTVVVGNRGHGILMGKLLGSVSTQVTMHADCPVVVVGEHVDGRKERRGVVVGVDGSSGSEQALAYAFEQASTRQTRLDVVHAWWTTVPGGVTVDLLRAQQTLQALGMSESMAGWSEKHPDVQVTEHLPLGPAVLALLEQARHAELLVVGSRGLGGFRRLMLGSVSHGVLQHAHCPVAVIRPRGDRHGS